LVLIGNGRFYGGSFKLFPADMRDGLLDVTVFPRVTGSAAAQRLGLVDGPNSSRCRLHHFSIGKFQCL
jgi:hypothetical protein